MAAASLSFVQFELVSVKIQGTIYKNNPILSNSEDIPQGILTTFQDHCYNLARFLSVMGLNKVTFQASLSHFKPETIVKITQAMSEVAETKRMKEVTAERLLEEDPQSIFIDHAQRSAEGAAKKHEDANQAYIDACAQTDFKVLF